MCLVPVDVLVVDIDDTLYLESEYVASGFQHVGDFVERELGCEHFSETCQRLHDEGTRSRIFDLALSYHGIPARPEIVRELVYEYRHHLPKIELTPDGKELLDYCYENEFPLAVISDGPLPSQQRKSEALGLSAVAEPIVLTDQWGKPFWKPHRRAFESVQKHFGQASKFVYVADNPDKDFSSPKQLGWQTVRIRRPGGLHEKTECSKRQDADVTVTSLSELFETDLLSQYRLSAA